MQPAELISALRHRYSTKIFDTKREVPGEIRAALTESLVLTPSSLGLQPWKFVVIRDKGLREKLLPHSYNQRQVVDCDHIVVFARKNTVGETEIETYMKSIAVTRGVALSTLEGFRGMISGFVSSHRDIDRWSEHQVYIALGQFITACAALGVDACALGGIVPTEYDTILDLKEKGYSSLVACAVGYRSAEDKYANLPKVRFSPADVIEHR